MKRPAPREPRPVEHQDVSTASCRTYLNQSGAGNPDAIVLLHGSGPGASAWSNWRFLLPVLGDTFRCLAPDLVGFAASAHPADPPVGVSAWLDLWVRQITDLLDALGLERVHLVGNSLGGAIALHLASRHPRRFKRIALMGSVGVPFTMNPKLDAIWGFYTDPSVEKMREMIRWFAYRPETFSEDLGTIARMRYDAAMDPKVRHSYQTMFPAPRQRHIDACVLADEALERIAHPCLLIHGRDDLIVPLETSLYLLQKLPDVRLHVFGQCSHWTQIEYADEFERLLRQFFLVDGDRAG